MTIPEQALSDTHIAITGATSGIGWAASLHFAAQGARLTLFCRNAEKASALCAGIARQGQQEPRVIIMDMSSLESVQRAAGEFLAAEPSLDVLLNNAGVVNTSRKESVDGFEETLAVNHFAPFVLTGMLLPALQRAAPGARIVNVASAAYAFVRSMRFDDMQATGGYRTFREYGRSKLANILFTRALAQRLRGSGISVNCLHPGAVSTALGTNNPGVAGRLLPLLLKPFFRSPAQGAATPIYLCTSPDVSTVSGEYFVNCKPAALKHWARDEMAAERLWQYTEEATGFSYPK